MRRLLAPLLVIGLSGAALAGCAHTGAAEATCERALTPGTVIDEVVVSDDLDAIPTFDGQTPVASEYLVFTDVVEGAGVPITATDQVISMALTAFDGRTGELLGSVGYDSPVEPIAMQQLTQAFPALDEMLECARPGTRTVGVLDPAESAPFGGSPGGSVVLVADVREVFLARADGAPRVVGESGLPAVALAPDGRPGITIPSSPPPTDLRVAVLKEGSGAVVQSTDTVRVAYTGVVWETGEVFDTSWDGPARSFPLTGVVAGWTEGLSGQTVGSQVLLVIPPELGYGDTDVGGIPSGSTLVFVVDILGIDQQTG